MKSNLLSLCETCCQARGRGILLVGFPSGSFRINGVVGSLRINAHRSCRHLWSSYPGIPQLLNELTVPAPQTVSVWDCCKQFLSMMLRACNRIENSTIPWLILYRLVEDAVLNISKWHAEPINIRWQCHLVPQLLNTSTPELNGRQFGRKHFQLYFPCNKICICFFYSNVIAVCS